MYLPDVSYGECPECIGEAVADNARPRVHSKAGFESVYQTGVLQLL